MKRFFLPLLLTALLALHACAAPAAPAQPEPAAPAQAAPAEPPAAEEAPADADVSQPAPIPDGIVTLNGRAYYYEDGAPVSASGLTELGGETRYVLPDGSLCRFEPGINDCGGTLFYHTGEAGYALLPPPAGLYDDGAALYCVLADGSLLQDGSEGYLTFGADGRFTSGSDTVDAGVEQLLLTSCPDTQASRRARLEAAYDYIRDHYRYLSMAHYDAGTDDWALASAEVFLQQGKGNCYCFSALFLYCARRLGYQAYVVAGHESTPTNDHAWVMIEEDGQLDLYDVQLEYAYLYQFGKGEVDMFGVQDAGGSVYNGFQYYFP